jgi:hypothetical protein
MWNAGGTPSSHARSLPQDLESTPLLDLGYLYLGLLQQADVRLPVSSARQDHCFTRANTHGEPALHTRRGSITIHYFNLTSRYTRFPPLHSRRGCCAPIRVSQCESLTVTQPPMTVY